MAEQWQARIVPPLAILLFGSLAARLKGAAPRRRRSRKVREGRRWSGAAGILATLAAALLSLTPFVQRWELRTQDLRFRLRGPRRTRARIVIVEISDDTLKAWPEPMYRWGSRYAQAIEQARELGASWIGLDFIHAVSGDRESDRQSDRQFALALAGGNVVLANSRAAQQNPIPALLFAHPEQPENVGFIDARRELDDAVRRAAVFDREGERLVPSFPAVLALRVQGRSPKDARALRALADPAADASGSGSLWINYVGPPDSFQSLPVQRLTDNRPSADQRNALHEALHGAVVLIGPTYAGSNDQPRGAGGYDYQGVEIHAHALATMLDHRPLHRAPPGQEAAVTAALGLLIAVAAALLPFGWGAALVGVVSAVWWWGASRAFAADAVWPTAGPMLAMGMAWAGHHLARSLEEAHRRQWIQGLFGRYVTPDIVDYLLRHPSHLQLGGEECEASVLFLDIRGFTAYSQGRPPAAVMDELNELFREIVPAIERCGGLLYKYTGDGLLAVFGAPRPVANHAQAAVDAASEIVRLSRRISTVRVSAGRQPVRVGCGVNSGLVVCGNLGDLSRAEYTVIGDTVNLAARLEELNKAPELNAEGPSQVVISRETYDRLAQPPPTRGPFELTIRGREGRLQVYQVQIHDE